MLVTVLVVGLTLTAAITDAWRHKIYNWNTYSGIVAGLAIHGLGTLLAQGDEAWSKQTRWVGWIDFTDSLLGFLACGAILLTCFVFFRVGGGDVKLMAMIGALLGLERGIETLLWTLVLGGAIALIVLIWRVGLWTLLSRTTRHVFNTLRLGMLSPLSEEERQALQPKLFLAPCALAAVLIVQFDLSGFLPLWQ